MAEFIIISLVTAYGTLVAGFWGGLFALAFVISVIVDPPVARKP